MREARTIDLGNCSVTLIEAGKLWLDGGAMFGIIPKALWARSYPCDDQNRIELSCNSLVVTWPGSARRVLIETGHGEKYAEKEQQIFRIDPQHNIVAALRAARIEPESITDVVLTHLHFDHAGGLTRMGEDGRPQPTFPQATVHVQRAEHTDARTNFGIMSATYREENFTPIDAAQRWNLLSGEVEILPGVRAMLTPGHTRGHHSIVIEGQERALVYGGDVMPTAQHVGAPYNMGYDVLPLDNRVSKQRLLEWLTRSSALFAIDHEVKTPIVRVSRKKDWYEVIPDAD